MAENACPPGRSHGAGHELSVGESTVRTNTKQASSNRNAPASGPHVTRTHERVAPRGSREPNPFLLLASVAQELLIQGLHYVCRTRQT